MGSSGWVSRSNAFQRRHTTIAHVRGQRAWISGEVSAARERDVGVVYQGEILVAVLEAVGEGAEARALGARVAVGEEGDVGASGAVGE